MGLIHATFGVRSGIRTVWEWPQLSWGLVRNQAGLSMRLGTCFGSSGLGTPYGPTGDRAVVSSFGTRTLERLGDRLMSRSVGWERERPA